MLHHDLVLKSDELYLVGEQHTDGSGERATGLYLRDTRHLSRFDVRLNGRPLERLGVRVLDPARAIVTEANQQLPVPDGASIRPLTISIQERVNLGTELTIGFQLLSYAPRMVPLALELELGADFRDLFDIRGFPRQDRSGEILPPQTERDHIRFGYRAPDGQLVETIVAFDRQASTVSSVNQPGTAEDESAVLLPGFDRLTHRQSPGVIPSGVARFDVDLLPNTPWLLSVTITLNPADERPVAGSSAAEFEPPSRRTQFSTGHRLFDRYLARCDEDLAALQTTFSQGSLPAAGIPWYVAPFGRDSLIVGLQTLHCDPDRAASTLRVLAALQGSQYDDERDEQPGKILHEVRYGEMARLKEVPHRPYFGTVDATPLFVMLFAETVRWTGDERLYRDLRPNALRAIEWLQTDGDPDGDGMIEYQARTSPGAHIIHQGWKDSHDSLHDRQGRPISGSIALVEVQGYAYAAYRGLADVERRLGDPELAIRLDQLADRVRHAVEASFWLAEEGFYAQALDAEKRPVDAIASNAGHLLYCGLPTTERARATIERLTKPDLDAGWGIRTLSSRMPTYNPMSYHNGSVWPHDNSLIAEGARRYGASDFACRIVAALFEVADREPLWRLPELFCGFPRAASSSTDAPVPYPVSCSPQAWAAGAGSLGLRTLLGLELDIAQRQLTVDPILPDWLDVIAVRGMRVLGDSLDFTVRRTAAGYVVDDERVHVSAAH